MSYDQTTADLIRENAELKNFAAGLEINLAAVIQRAEAAEAKLAEAQKDTERLNKLIKIAANCEFDSFDKEDIAWEIIELLYFCTTDNGIEHDSPRAAIDAARAEITRLRDELDRVTGERDALGKAISECAGCRLLLPRKRSSFSHLSNNLLGSHDLIESGVCSNTSTPFLGTGWPL